MDFGKERPAGKEKRRDPCEPRRPHSRENLLSHLGDGRLTDPPVSVKALRLRNHDPRGCSRPKAQGLD